MWLQRRTRFLTRHVRQSWLLKPLCNFCVSLPCCFFYRCITTVTPSRVCELLLLPHCVSVGGLESRVYAGFTRCWFNRRTDDRLSQQLKRQIHSPTLGALLPFLLFSVSVSLFPRSYRFSLAHTHTHTHPFCVWFSYNTVKLQIIISKPLQRVLHHGGAGNKTSVFSSRGVIYFRCSNKHPAVKKKKGEGKKKKKNNPCTNAKCVKPSVLKWQIRASARQIKHDSEGSNCFFQIGVLSWLCELQIPITKQTQIYIKWGNYYDYFCSFLSVCSPETEQKGIQCFGGVQLRLLNHKSHACSRVYM